MNSTAVYFRVSTAIQSQDSQEREVMAFVKRAGWKPFTVYRDTISGAKATRPGLEKLLQDARAGKVSRVVAWKLDRLGRSLVHFVQLSQELAKLKIPIICTSQGIDTSEDSPTGRLQLQMMAAFAEFERSLIAERVRAGQAQARAQGVKFGRPPLPPDLKAKIKKLAQQGLSCREIAEKTGVGKSTVAQSQKRIASIRLTGAC